MVPAGKTPDLEDPPLTAPEPSLPHAVRLHLAPGERVLWIGKPRQIRAATGKEGLAWARAGGALILVAVLVLLAFGARPGTWWSWLPATLLLTGLLLAAGGGLHWSLTQARRDHRARTTFVLSSRRAFAQEDGTGEGPDIWPIGTGETAPLLVLDGEEEWALLFRHWPAIEAQGSKFSPPTAAQGVEGEGFTGLPRDSALLGRFAEIGVDGVSELRWINANAAV